MGHLERRACQRFAVPGASLNYRTHSSLPFRGDHSEKGCLVLDLSRGGVRFLAMDRLRRGASVRMEILIPDDAPPLSLTGRVVWSEPHPGGAWRTGVHFSPFGEAQGPNTVKKLERIEDLEAQFVEMCA